MFAGARPLLHVTVSDFDDPRARKQATRVTSVSIEFEGVRLAVDESLLAAAVARVEGVPDVGHVDIVIAGDLEESVRCRLNPEQARLFSLQRVSGAVGAKTMPNANGCEVAVQAQLLVPGVAARAGVDLLRLFEHEAWHVALHRRGETKYRLPSPTNQDIAEAHYLGQADVLVEEYRVERALREGGAALDATYVPSAQGVLSSCLDTMRNAVGRFSREGIADCYETVVPAFNSLTTHLTYLAANETKQDELAAFRGWRRLVAGHYRVLCDSLVGVPSASTRRNPEILDRCSRRVSQGLHAWLLDVGFEMRTEDGGLYFEITRYEF